MLGANLTSVTWPTSCADVGLYYGLHNPFSVNLFGLQSHLICIEPRKWKCNLGQVVLVLQFCHRLAQFMKHLSHSYMYTLFWFKCTFYCLQLSFFLFKIKTNNFPVLLFILVYKRSALMIILYLLHLNDFVFSIRLSKWLLLHLLSQEWIFQMKS